MRLKIMEILQAAMDKMGLSSKRLATLFVVFFIAFPAVLIVTSMYQNSSFGLFEGFSKGKVLGGTAQNVTAELSSGGPNVTTNGLGFEGRVQNITYENLGGIHNNTMPEVSNRVTTPLFASEFFYLFSFNFLLLCLVLTDQNSLYFLNGLGQVKVLPGKTQNSTATEGRATAKHIIAVDVGSRIASLTSSTNDSTPHTGNPDDKDKLLDGLLASGFDETSCMSRLQSHLYRKASPHKPSPYLISKLRNYEEIHRRCGPNSTAYNRNMKNIVHFKNNGAAAICNCKYLVWTPANGLGNRMISMAATFLYAVLTDRVLLVRFGTDMHGLFCEPFLNSTWILPKKSHFWNQEHVETYQSMLVKDRANNSKEDLPSALFLNLQHTRNDPEKFFHCDHNQDLLRKVPLLIVQSDQYFVPSLFMNPSFNLETTKMFPEKDTVFHHLGRYLFHPSNEAWGLISRFYQAYLAKADERIGLQIRVFNPDSTPQQAVMDVLLSCTIKNKLLPEVDMQNSVSSTRKNQTVKAVLVTSLYPEYAENLRTMYLEKPTVTGELIGVYQPSHEEHQKFGDNMQNMKAWTEMYLLSLCDVLVTTSRSTFGYVAQGLGGLKSWLLYRLNKNKTHSPPCNLDFSSEPCFHFPPKHECNGKPQKHFASSFPHVWECKDYHKGVKLVNGSA